MCIAMTPSTAAQNMNKDFLTIFCEKQNCMENINNTKFRNTVFVQFQEVPGNFRKQINKAINSFCIQ
jgi:hypothetical protein